MSFPVYPAYRKAKVEWLEKIPSHWHDLRLKNLLSQRITDGPHTTPEFQISGVPFLSVDGIQDGELVFEGCRFVTEAEHVEYSKKANPIQNDILMGKAASTGKIARVKVDFPFSIWSPLALIRVDELRIMPSFAEYWLKSPVAQAEIDVLCTSNTQKNISMDDIPKLAIFLPPMREQQAIVTFLDSEVSKINSLIEEQEKLVGLLNEKRSSMISSAVLRGVDPSAEIVPVQGSIGLYAPKGWTQTVIKRFATLQRGHDLTNDERVDGPFPVVTSSGPNGYHSKYMAKGPGVVMGRYGSTGKIFYIEENYWPHNTSLYVNNFHGNLPRFVWYFFQTVDFAAHSQKSAVPGIDRNDIHVLPVAIPSLTEQSKIVDFLEVELERIDSLLEEANRSTCLLIERRSALTSAAVTGKIDVRGFVTPQPCGELADPNRE
jgi:type I restriction enzyme S subunit